MNDSQTRFGAVGRLFGQEGLERLRRAHVCVVARDPGKAKDIAIRFRTEHAGEIGTKFVIYAKTFGSLAPGLTLKKVRHRLVSLKKDEYAADWDGPSWLAPGGNDNRLNLTAALDLAQ